MNAYEAKQEARRERMAERAEKLRDYAAKEYRKADLREEVSGIPLGQPILIGHHSERKHRRAIERSDQAMRRAIDAGKAADRLEDRIHGSECNSAISSDDPAATDKLAAKIAKAEELQERMKLANKLLRKKDVAGLTAAGFTQDQINDLFTPDFCGRTGFPNYALTNNNANIRRMKERLVGLERRSGMETKEQETNGVRVVENVEGNRLQLFFPGKPESDIRRELKSCGFRWAPSVGAWQRHLNNGARYAAECVLKKVSAI